MAATKVLSALAAAGSHNGEEFQGKGPHALFYTRSASSTLTLQVKDPEGNWQSLQALSSGSSDGVVIVHLVDGHDHRVITPNAGFESEAWISEAGENPYNYSGGV